MLQIDFKVFHSPIPGSAQGPFPRKSLLVDKSAEGLVGGQMNLRKDHAVWRVGVDSNAPFRDPSPSMSPIPIEGVLSLALLAVTLLFFHALHGMCLPLHYRVPRSLLHSPAGSCHLFNPILRTEPLTGSKATGAMRRRVLKGHERLPPPATRVFP